MKYKTIPNDPYQLNAYRFVGSLTGLSKPTCRRWIEAFGGKLPIEILQLEIDLVYKYTDLYQGLKVTIETFAEIKGWSECRHRVIPYRATESEIEEAIKIQKRIGPKYYI